MKNHIVTGGFSSIEQATGKKVEQKLTTDYAIAIESLSNGTAQIGCSMGGEGYCQAKKANDAVNPLFVLSGESGTLDDALYYSFFAVREAEAENYKSGDSYSIDNIKGKKMSFGPTEKKSVKTQLTVVEYK